MVRHAPLSRSVQLLVLAAVATALLALAWPNEARAYSGQIQWVYLGASPVGLGDSISASAPGPGGTVYAAGYVGFKVAPTNLGDLQVQRLGPTLSNGSPVMWSAPWDNPVAHGLETAVATTTDRSGNVVTLGKTQAGEGKEDWAVVKWSSSGQFAWAATSGATHLSGDRGNALATDRAGNVYVAGQALLGPTAGTDLVVRKLGAADGTTLWTRSYHGAASPQGTNAAAAIAVDATGNAYVGGVSTGVGNVRQNLILKLTPGGRQAWLRTIKDPAGTADLVQRVALRGKALYVAGRLGGPGGQSIPMIARYTTGGSRVWMHTWSGLAASALTTTEALALDGQGNAILGGTTLLISNDSRGFVASWTPAGKRRWVRTYLQPGATVVRSEISALAADGAGNIWAAGSAGVSVTDTDALLLRLSPAGRVTWARIYDRGFNRYETFSTVSLFGKTSVFAGGQAWSQASDWDSLGIRYQR